MDGSRSSGLLGRSMASETAMMKCLILSGSGIGS